MNDMPSLMINVLTYGLIFFGFIFFVGSALLWWRTRTIPTALFLFGLLLTSSFSIFPLIFSLVGISVSFPYWPLTILISLMGSICQGVGLLLYALSLTKK